MLSSRLDSRLLTLSLSFGGPVCVVSSLARPNFFLSGNCNVLISTDRPRPRLRRRHCRRRGGADSRLPSSFRQCSAVIHPDRHSYTRLREASAMQGSPSQTEWALKLKYCTIGASSLSQWKVGVPPRRSQFNYNSAECTLRKAENRKGKVLSLKLIRRA